MVHSSRLDWLGINKYKIGVIWVYWCFESENPVKWALFEELDKFNEGYYKLISKESDIPNNNRTSNADFV